MAIAIVLAILIFKFISISRELPSVADISDFAPEESTRIYYADTDADMQHKMEYMANAIAENAEL